MNNYLKYAEHVGASEFVKKWIKSTLKNKLDKETISTETVEHIIDFLVQTDKKIERMSYDQALKLTTAWDKALQKKGKTIDETPEDTETVLDFGDGFKIVKLVGENAYKREGFLMRHCVGSYHGNGKEIYSLRDKDNMPHCTMEKDQQIKGKGNGDIHPKYVDYVVKFLEYTGMTVGDSEMKHLGYVNVEKILEEEPDLVFPELYNGKYFNESLLPKVENKDRMSLWGTFKLFNFGSDMEVSFNFDFQKCREYFKSKFTDIVSKNDSNKVAMHNYNKVAMDDSNEVAMHNYNKVAMDDSNKVAMHNYNKVAMDDSNKVAMDDSNKVAMHNYNKVAMDDSNEVAMHNYNKVAMDNYNKVAMRNYNNAVGNYRNTIQSGNHNVVVMGDESKVKGKKGTLIVLYERDDKYEIINYITKMVDGKEVKEDTFYELKGGQFIESTI